MSEKRIPIQTYLVQYFCDRCNAEMKCVEAVGDELYLHQCTACKCTDVFDKSYPRVERIAVRGVASHHDAVSFSVGFHEIEAVVVDH